MDSHLEEAYENLTHLPDESDMDHDDSDMRDIDESMDGDHESALASAGFGTDEDYGGDCERF